MTIPRTEQVAKRFYTETKVPAFSFNTKMRYTSSNKWQGYWRGKHYQEMLKYTLVSELRSNFSVQTKKPVNSLFRVW